MNAEALFCATGKIFWLIIACLAISLAVRWLFGVHPFQPWGQRNDD